MTLEDQIAQAEALVQQSRYDDAISAFQQAIEAAMGQSALNSAAHCYTRLSWAAWRGGMVGQAAQFSEEGVTRLASAPASPELAGLYQEAARAQAHVGNTSRARPLAKRAIEIARMFDQKSVQAQALNTLAVSSWGVEKPDDLIAMAREAVALTDAIDDKLAGARAHNNLGTALGGKMGRFREAHFHFRRSVDLSKEIDFKIGILYGLANVADALLFLGDIREARKQLAAMQDIRAAMQTAEPENAVISIEEARLLRQEGKLDEAFDAFTALYRQAHEANDSQEMAQALAWLADVAYELDRLDEVLPALEQAPDESVSTIYLILVRAYQALAYDDLGRWDDEAAALERGAALARAIPGTWGELWLKLADARITAVQGRAVDALPKYEALSDEFMRREMRWHRARLRLERAGVAHVAGRQSHAIYLLKEALAEFNSMGVEFYAKQAQNRLDELSG